MLTYIAAYDIFSEIYSDSFGDLYSVKILTSLLWLANIFIYFLLNLKCNKFVDKTFDIINYSDSLLISLNFNCTKLADTFMLYYLTTTSWLSLFWGAEWTGYVSEWVVALMEKQWSPKENAGKWSIFMVSMWTLECNCYNCCILKSLCLDKPEHIVEFQCLLVWERLAFHMPKYL
jgi:hypothetical protein